jgi:hypothetical protein
MLDLCPNPGEWKPDLGDYLGDLADEVPDNRILEFVTGGPKNYAYKIARPDKDGNTTICKVRGITLNYKNSLTRVECHYISMTHRSIFCNKNRTVSCCSPA